MGCTPVKLLALPIMNQSIWYALDKVHWHMNSNHTLYYGIYRTQERKPLRKLPIIIELFLIYSLTLLVPF